MNRSQNIVDVNRSVDRCGRGRTLPVFEPKERIYQRLLAGDQEEAAELTEEHLKKIPLVEVYDMILIPALAMAETHWQLGELNDGKHKFILQSLKDMIQYHGEKLQQENAKIDILLLPCMLDIFANVFVIDFRM